MKYKNLIYLLPLTVVMFSGCKNKTQDFVGLSFENQTFTYDGQPHSISVTGNLPNGAVIDYGSTGNEFTNSGSYPITATVSCSGYNAVELNAILTIENAQYEGIVFNNLSVPYDGQPHSIAPIVPESYAGAVVTYGENGNTFTEAGVYVVEAKVSKANYVDWVGSAKLKILGEPLMIADFEGLSDNRLGDQFTYQVYDNGWKTPSTATINIAKNQAFGTGSSTMRMYIYHNTLAFKATKELKNLKNGKPYSGFSLDTFVDDASANSQVKIQFQLQFKDLPLPDFAIGYKDTYITYTLGTDCPKNWTHWEVPFTDSTLSIASGAITLDGLRQLGYDYSIEDFMPYLDRVAVLAYGNVNDNGSKTSVCVDNIKLINCNEKTIEQGTKIENKVYTIKSSDDTVYKLSLNHGDARFETLNLEENVVLEGTYTLNGTQLAVSVAPDGVNFVNFAFDSLFNGSQLTLLGSPTGNVMVLMPLLGHIDFEDSVLKEVVKLDDFESYEETGQGYDREHTQLNQVSGLRAAYYGELWKDDSTIPDGLINEPKWKTVSSVNWPTYLELEENGHNGKCLNAYSPVGWGVRYLSFGLATGKTQPIGRGDFLSFYLKGTVSKMNVRVFYVNQVTRDNASAKSGYCSFYEAMPITSEWTQVFVPLDPAKQVYGFMISPPSAEDGRIYIDDVEIIGNGNPHATFKYPEFKDGNYYLKNNTSVYNLEISNSLTAATLSKVGEATTYDLDLAVNKRDVVLTDSTNSGADLTINGRLNEDYKVDVISVEGTLASSLSGDLLNKQFNKFEHINLDFEEVTSDDEIPFDDNRWTLREEGETADSDDNHITSFKAKAAFGKVIRLETVADVRTFTFTPEFLIGPVNNFTVKLGNFAKATEGDGYVESNIDYKIVLVDENDELVYLAGSADSYASIENTKKYGSDLRTVLDINFDLTIGKKVQIITKCDAGTAKLAVDSLAFTLK